MKSFSLSKLTEILKQCIKTLFGQAVLGLLTSKILFLSITQEPLSLIFFNASSVFLSKSTSGYLHRPKSFYKKNKQTNKQNKTKQNKQTKNNVDKFWDIAQNMLNFGLVQFSP